MGSSMGTQIDSLPQPPLAEAAAESQFVEMKPQAAAKARHQRFGLVTLGVLLCLAAVVRNQVGADQGAERWLWLASVTVVSIVCLVRAHRHYGGVGADRDASPYYGIFAGATSGAVLLTLLTVDGWILVSVVFAMAAVLAFMAWIEQSTIGMTAAMCVAVLCAGYGTASLNDGHLGDAVPVGLGTMVVGVMLIVGAAALAGFDGSRKPDPIS